MPILLQIFAAKVSKRFSVWAFFREEQTDHNRENIVLGRAAGGHA